MDGGMPEGKGAVKGTFMLSGDMLPSGVELNEGDSLKVVRCTEDGDYEIAKQGGDGDGKAPWEHEFKDYMSSRNDGQNPPPPEEQEMM